MKLLGQTFKMGGLVVGGLLSVWLARAAVQENDIVPMDQLVEINCNGDSVPEDVLELVGDLHVLTTQTVDKAGGVHTTVHFQPVNVSAVGELTGDTYRAVGLTRESVTLKGDNVSDTYVNNFYMIGQRSGIKYLVHETFHLTIVNGNVVVSFDHSDVRCQ
jgi:hypothetical protein